MDKDQKTAQLEKSRERIEGPAVSELDELNILERKGIEYKAGDMQIIVPPLKIKQIRVLHEIEKLYANMGMPSTDKLIQIIKKICEVLNLDQEKFEENADAEDLRMIIRIMAYSYLVGKKIFEKKSLMVKDLPGGTARAV